MSEKIMKVAGIVVQVIAGLLWWGSLFTALSYWVGTPYEVYSVALGIWVALTVIYSVACLPRAMGLE